MSHKTHPHKPFAQYGWWCKQVSSEPKTKTKVSSKYAYQSWILIANNFASFTCAVLSDPRFTTISLDKLMGMLSFCGFFRQVNRNLRSCRINTLKRKGYEKDSSEIIKYVTWWCFRGGECLLGQSQKRLPLWWLLCTAFAPELHWCFLQSRGFMVRKSVFLRLTFNRLWFNEGEMSTCNSYLQKLFNTLPHRASSHKV